MSGRWDGRQRMHAKCGGCAVVVQLTLEFNELAELLEVVDVLLHRTHLDHLRLHALEQAVAGRRLKQQVQRRHLGERERGRQRLHVTTDGSALKGAMDKGSGELVDAN